MMTHKLISADSHIVEPPDLYTTRIEPKFRDRAPRLERLETPTGRLSRGALVGHVIECPLHYATFDVRTGKLLSGPVSADVPSYEVRLIDDTVYVKRASER